MRTATKGDLRLTEFGARSASSNPAREGILLVAAQRGSVGLLRRSFRIQRRRFVRFAQIIVRRVIVDSVGDDAFARSIASQLLKLLLSQRLEHSRRISRQVSLHRNPPSPWLPLESRYSRRRRGLETNTCQSCDQSAYLVVEEDARAGRFRLLGVEHPRVRNVMRDALVG